jgi:AAA+ superfamily predicted ATPase
VSRINVLVAATSLDIQAEAIAAAIAARTDMVLVESRVVAAAEVAVLLESIPLSPQCALVLVGPHVDTEEPAERWLAERKDLVVLRVDTIDDVVRIEVRDVRLDSLLAALRELVDHAGASSRARVSRFQFQPASAGGETGVLATADTPRERPLLIASINWIHAVLRNAVEKLTGSYGDLPGLTVTATTVAKLLGAPTALDVAVDVETADVALSKALAAADAETEPLAAAARILGLNAIEFRLMVLALGPELDPRYQRCVGLLLDDLGRRVGTLGLHTALLGEASRVRRELAEAGNLARWRVFEGYSGSLPPADEPLRLDKWLAGWLLGEWNALNHDPRVRRAMRLAAWAGADLLDCAQDRDRASSLVSKLQSSDDAHWTVFAGGDPAGWRGLLELGAQALHLSPIRVEVTRFGGLDVADIEESGIRLGRMARLTGCPLVIDASDSDEGPQEEDRMRLFFAAVCSTGCRAAVISNDAASTVRLLGSASYEIENKPLSASTRIAAVRAAAAGAEAFLTEDMLEATANQYPLQIDGLEQAMRLALTKPLAYDGDDPRSERFIAACKEVAAEGVSRLAERIEPVFKLDDVVLPTDRKQQLEEIVDNIRLAPKVLDGWKFREQLPYGRGVTALFHGPSGTGKTMAALGVGEKLGIQILRIDLSRVVSKYIGDTEKNIDRVFFDAQKSGAAILIDEADALLGKRSEVKDAHDRYANIEVAYLLQRMEAYEGLAILTTNLRQNLDPAFLRRLRFIVDFPRPDADARAKIWRRCLPDESHTLDDAAFRQLARKIDLTGGHIRQITLRAAFVAAAGGSKIRLDHVAHASRAEFAKLGLPPVEIDLAERRRAA